MNEYLKRNNIYYKLRSSDAELITITVLHYDCPVSKTIKKCSFVNLINSEYG